MKKTRNLLTAIALVSVSTLQAGAPKTFTFDASKEATDYVTTTKKTTLLKVETDGNEGMLTFQATKGGVFVALTPGGELKTSGDGLELEFRTEGYLSFGVITRGHDVEDPAYIVHCSFLGDNCSIMLSRSTVSSQQKPGENDFAHKMTKTYKQGEWYRLRLGSKAQGQSGTLLSAEINDMASGETLLEVEGTDEAGSLPATGQVFLRFNAVSADGGGKIDIRKVTFQD
jgi:hypothetical protein